MSTKIQRKISKFTINFFFSDSALLSRLLVLYTCDHHTISDGQWVAYFCLFLYLPSQQKAIVKKRLYDVQRIPDGGIADPSDCRKYLFFRNT